ncbi:MAG: glycosyltransferase, partial [Gammaproteobacteria bacterium]
MNILMMTNTYAPHVGGVARSVEGLAGAFRARGHQVLVAAPLFKDTPENERGVIRFPAVKDFNGSAFSVPMPAPLRLVAALKQFRPEIIHSPHPFLLGGTALRVAAARRLPVVFTYHTMYEKYTHYAPGDSQTMKHFVMDLVRG